MTFSAKTVADVRQSWVALSLDRETLMASFFDELFRIAPEVRAIFANTDLAAHRLRVAAAIGLVVANCERFENVVPVLEDLGAQHARFRLTDAHFDAVGAALLHAIAAFHGPSHTPAIQAAWTEVLGAVATAMKAGVAANTRKSA